MKRWIAIVLLLGSASKGYAQYDREFWRIYKPFRVAAGIGYAVPGAGENAAGGLLVYGEPAYRVTDQVQVGLRVEAASPVRGSTGVTNGDISQDHSSVVSYTLNALYYFGNNEVRPFIGLGVGFFRLAPVSYSTAGDNGAAGDVAAETSFGFYPLAGLDVGHVNLTLEYNVIAPTDVPGGGEVKNNLLGIRAGVFIGGGKNGPAYFKQRVPRHKKNHNPLKSYDF